MSRPDDSLLTAEQLANVQRHADRLLREAAALGRFPTPINDILAAAKVTVVDDELLNESVLQRFITRAKVGLATIKSALTKVMGLFEATERLVVIDRETPKPRVPFVKLHEVGHGSMPHQTQLYRMMHDCERTLDPDISDLFEREANVFASEALFQGAVFAEQAHDRSFGVKTGIALAKQFGSSNYAAFRRYVRTNSRACCFVALEQMVFDEEGGFRAEVRRVVASTTFASIYDPEKFGNVITREHPLGALMPRGRQRMVPARDVVLVDRNGQRRECIGDAFNTKHQILILLRDNGALTKTTIVMPHTAEFRETVERLSNKG